MKHLIHITAAGMALFVHSWAQETRTPLPEANQAPSWSLVYLPDLEWTETEAKQTVALLQQLKPDLVASLSPCAFAEAIRNLDCKPTVLDPTQRNKLGKACGIPAIPLATYQDTSTFHSISGAENKTSGLVWLSAESSKKPFNGPAANIEELGTLARMQVRKQLADRQGEVIFLIDPSVPTPAEAGWRLPRNHVQYEQAPSAMTGFACIRPDTLQVAVPAIDGIAARVPVLHWIHAGAKGMEWDVLPIDGGPAIQHSTFAGTTKPGDRIAPTIHHLKAPTAPSEVPLWMDDYVNNNPALESGNAIPRGAMKRRFGWKNYGVTRDPFQVLRSQEEPKPEAKPETIELPRGAVRSPGNRFSITVGQLSEKGWYPIDGDDGINVYLDDRRVNKIHMLYFAGLYDAWPSAATWFTDRYVITSGTGVGIDDWDDETNETPTPRPLTLRLFDLRTGQSFVTSGFPQAEGRSNAPTERVYFPTGSLYSYAREQIWQFLWGSVEKGYEAKPQPAPFTAEEVAAIAEIPAEAGLKWKDLGIWPAPETWRLAPEAGQQGADEKSIDGGDPFLTYTQTVDGQRNYKLAIMNLDEHWDFERDLAHSEVAAQADLFTTGEGRLPKLETIQRIGERKRHLALAGSFQKPDATQGRWMILIDSLDHRAWSAHW